MVRIALVVLVVLGPLALGGCYSHVVGADDSYRGTVHEPNLKEDEGFTLLQGHPTKKTRIKK